MVVGRAVLGLEDFEASITPCEVGVLNGCTVLPKNATASHGEASKDIVGRLVFLSLSLLFSIVLFNANAPKSSWDRASQRRVQNHMAAEEKRLAGR